MEGFWEFHLNQTSREEEPVLCSNLLTDGMENDSWDPGESQPRKLLLVNPCSVLIPYTDQGHKGNYRKPSTEIEETETID